MTSVLGFFIDIGQGINNQINALLNGAKSTDTFFIIGFIVATILFSLILKRKRVVVFSLAIYVVTALYQALPFNWGMEFGSNVWIFLGAVIAIFLLLQATIASSFYNSANPDYSGRIKLLLLSFITLGFLVSSALIFVTDPGILSNITLVNKIFSGDVSRGIWAVLPLAGFLFLRK